MTSAGHWLSCQSKAQMSMEEARKVDIKYPLCVGHTNISFIVCLWANRSHQGSSVPLTVCVCAKSLQLCPALCNTMDFPRLLCLWVFSRQEHWSELPFASPGDLPNPGMEPMSLMSPALAGRFFTTSTAGENSLLVSSNFWCLMTFLGSCCLSLFSVSLCSHSHLFYVSV